MQKRYKFIGIRGVGGGCWQLQGVRNSIKAEKELVLKEGLVLLLGTVLRQRRISTMRGVELREREREGERERE